MLYTPDHCLTLAYAEDFKPIRKLFSSYLSQQGFIVKHEANNGKELLEQLANTDSLPDVCLLDLNMPIMDGFETAQRIKKEYPTVKILAYSNNSLGGRVEEILRCGAQDFIEKYSEPEVLKEALLKVFYAGVSRHNGPAIA